MNNQRKITKFAFYAADIVCWLMVLLSASSLVAAFFPPLISTWTIELPIILVISLEVSNALINGFGYYLLTRRKPVGFVVIIATHAVSLIASKYFNIQTVYYLLVVFVVVSMPWLIVSKEISNEAKT